MTNELDLSEREYPPEMLVELALADSKLMQQLLAGVAPQPQKAAVRSNCSKALLSMAEKRPEVLLPCWGYFSNMLKCTNGYSKYVAVYVLANLVRVDPQCRFEDILDDFYTLLGDESTIVACHTAAVSPRIVQSRPELEPRITRKLLGFDQLQSAGAHNDLVAAYIIEAFRAYFDKTLDKDSIVGFVWKRQECSSPKTRKIAREFIKQVSN